MARIKWGMFVTDGRGKVGGHVLTKTRSGATVRTKVTPSNPKTSFQGSVRAIFGGVSKRWGSLTEAQRQTWLNATPSFMKTNVFGDQYKPSGKNLFTALNSNLLNVGVPSLPTAPQVGDTPYLEAQEVNVDVSSSEISLLYTSSIVTGDYVVVLEATAPLSIGKYNFSGQYRKIGQWSSSDIPTVLEMFGLYVNKFGTPVVGKKISFRLKAVMIATGQASPLATIDTIVEA